MFHRLASTIAATLLLTACSGATVLHEDRLTSGIESWYSYGAASRDLQLVVVGGPFAMPGDEFQRMVERAVQVQTLLAPTRPRLSPSADARPPFRLVVGFVPASGTALCAGQAGAGGPQSDAIPLHIAFCRAETVIAEVAGQMGAVAGPQDPGFQNSIAAAMAVLFKPDVKEPGNCPDC